MQIELFNDKPEYPHQRQPTAAERALIISVFGEQAITGISCILNDVLQLYPFKSYTRPSAMYEQISFLCIGASCEHDGYFYFMDAQYCIWLFHNFSMFPDNKRYKNESKTRHN